MFVSLLSRQTKKICRKFAWWLFFWAYGLCFSLIDEKDRNQWVLNRSRKAKHMRKWQNMKTNIKGPIGNILQSQTSQMINNKKNILPEQWSLLVLHVYLHLTHSSVGRYIKSHKMHPFICASDTCMNEFLHYHLQVPMVFHTPLTMNYRHDFARWKSWAWSPMPAIL